MSAAVRVGALLFGCGVASCGSWACASPATLMRYPTTSATEVAFVARGGLWTAPLAGGRATRLPVGSGEVVAPRFSPDGRWIAFTRWTGDARDVYVIPSAGGAARRLTFDGNGRPEDDLVLAWTRDGSSIVFLSDHDSPTAKLYQAFAVPLVGGQTRRLPLDRAGQLSFSPDGDAIVFNRIFRNFELRKRYLGGQHQDLFTYDFPSTQLVRLTDWKGTDTSPMWAGRKIYFLSDRGAGFRQNIWVYDLDTRATRQVTHFSDFDVDWPSLGAGGIAFQQGGKLYRLDLPSERLHELEVEVPDDGASIAPTRGRRQRSRQGQGRARRGRLQPVARRRSLTGLGPRRHRARAGPWHAFRPHTHAGHR